MPFFLNSIYRTADAASQHVNVWQQKDKILLKNVQFCFEINLN